MTHLMTSIPGPPGRGRLAWADDDASIVAAAAAGDVAAQERLWREHVDCVHRVCASMLGRHDAEDAVADTFLAAFASAGGFDARRGSVQAWLLGIAVNQVRRRWRRDRRVATMLERLRVRDRDAGAGDLADDVIARAHVGEVREALARLGDADRLVLVTQAAGDLSPTELATSLGCSPGAAKVRLHRARRRLRDHLARTHATGALDA